MRSILLISWKEIRQRVFNRSFVLSLILGPVFILTCVYILVKAADEGKKNVHVLIADPGDIFATLDGLDAFVESMMPAAPDTVGAELDFDLLDEMPPPPDMYIDLDEPRPKRVRVNQRECDLECITPYGILRYYEDRNELVAECFRRHAEGRRCRLSRFTRFATEPTPARRNACRPIGRLMAYLI